MAFSKSARPKRPGAYVNWVAAQAVAFIPSQGSIVAVAGTTNWGPFEVSTLCTSFQQYRAIFGYDDDTPSELDKAVRQAFQGEDVLSRGGAGGVLVHRFGGSAAHKAAKTINNTAAAAAITLTARYEGSRGNNLRITTQDYAPDATKTQLIVYENTVELERFTYLDADITSLGAEINAKSDWLTATVTVSGTALAATTSSALTTGNDGTTVIASDWTDVLSALSTESFGVLAPANLTDGSILASLVAWSQGLNANGQRFMTIVGGGLSDDIDDALDRSSTIGDENFINLGVGSLVDDTLGELSTAQLAPRVAGIVAARGEAKQITAARLGGVSAILNGADSQAIDSAIDGGVVVFTRDNYQAAPIHIEKGVTTWGVDLDSTDKPHRIFGNPKFVRTMQGIETDIRALGQAPGFIGELPVNDRTRSWAVGEVGALLREREGRDVLQPGSIVSVDQDPPPSDDDEYIGLAVGLKFGRDVEQFFMSITVA